MNDLTITVTMVLWAIVIVAAFCTAVYGILTGSLI